MNILFEDSDLIVCEKPVGMASQNERGFQKDMVSWLLQYVKNEGASSPYIGVVHRLDKMVGGVMVYAKTKRAAASLSAQAAGREMKKHYYAVVCGVPELLEGTLEDYLARDAKSNTSFVCDKGDKAAKRALLNYKVLETRRLVTSEGKELDCTLLDVELLTGRHHQIRVQFASRNLPLAGDRKYNHLYQNVTGDNGVGLYAHRLAFTHPVTGEKMEFEQIPEKGIFAEFTHCGKCGKPV